MKKGLNFKICNLLLPNLKISILNSFSTVYLMMPHLFSDYAFMSEHLDLRHIMGPGIAITRGSAASLSFCYSLLLLTMCRNLITKMKEHSLHQYIPLDSHLQFHKIVACTGTFYFF